MTDQTAPIDLQPRRGAAGSQGAHRFSMLDGWRATSIVLVLCAHLLPIGPKSLRLNEAVAAMGMALFFTLSGFLITRFLAGEHASVRVFVIRRFFRIVPLSWLVCAVVLPLSAASATTYAAHFLFYANLPPFRLLPATTHLWSLCVEMQFYVGIAILVALFGRRALYSIPLICVGVTAYRFYVGAEISIVTWLRLDEILAGGTLALAYAGWFGGKPLRVLRYVNVYAFLPLVLLSAHPAGQGLDYLRPYLASAMIGSSLISAPPVLAKLFEHRVTAWIATISYALYIIHGVLMHTWLASGDTVVRYLKRPLLFAVTFAAAHLSTYKFEQPLVRLAKRLTSTQKVGLAQQ